MKNITIAQRIMMLILASIAALLIVGFVGLYVAKTETDSINTITDDSLAGIVVISEARQAFMDVRTNLNVHLANPNQEAKAAAEQRLEAAEKLARQLLKDYEKLVNNDDDKKLLAGDVESMNAYLELIHSRVIPLSRKNESDTDENRQKGAAASGKVMKAFNDHLAFNKKEAADTTKVALASAAQGRIYTLIAIVLSILAIGALGFFLLRNIKSSLSRIQSMVNRIENDLDFTVRVAVSSQDEIGQTTSALNRLLEKLQGSLKSIATNAQSVASAAGLMSTTSTEVATASHEQSEAASNMAATVEEMTVSINHVADRAQEANRISSESGQLATSGEKVIGQTVSDIRDIAATVNEAAELIHGLEQHSQQISNVVAVIKEVADQTNLLALNAAIEAARAGEQGRGFAVVADEVRKLAERTAVSTQEIARTIDTMRSSAGNAVISMQGVVSKVAHGVERAQEADAAIKQLGEGSRNAVGMVEEITAAIREQGSATNNIAAQVERIAQMSEESSAAAGNSAQTARDLDRLATEMQRIVGTYRL